MAPRAAIVGLSGPRLTAGERAYLKAADPLGIILFARNVETPDQVAGLVGEARAALGRVAPVLIDQEGGRVQRLGPPHWRRYPPARRFEAIEKAAPAMGLEAARLGARLIADDLQALGIDVDCLPLLDVPLQGAHDIIGDRAYGHEADSVIRFAAPVLEGLAEGGVLGVIKHLPGHGRAFADSHEELPRVDAPLEALKKSDFPPFRAFSDAPFAMTAHVVYEALDPDLPVTWSASALAYLRRELKLGAALMSDDLSMKALDGPMRQRAERAIAAGCDLALHCNGDAAEMDAVAEGTPHLEGEALARVDRALTLRHAPAAFDRKRAERRFDALLALAGGEGA